jgi:hypothetical protein
MQFSVIFHDHIKSSFGRIINECIVPKVTIEIGVFEGESTFNITHLMVQQNPEYKHYAIDPFSASENLKQEVVDSAKAQFKSNMEEFPQVELIEKNSFEGLIELYNRGVKADLIYVDGSHFAKDVLTDAAIGFEMLNVGGVMLFDDAVSWRYGQVIQDSPKIAIDAFIMCNWNRLKVLEMPNGYQTAIQKTS